MKKTFSNQLSNLQRQKDIKFLRIKAFMNGVRSDQMATRLAEEVLDSWEALNKNVYEEDTWWFDPEDTDFICTGNTSVRWGSIMPPGSFKVTMSSNCLSNEEVVVRYGP